MDDTQAPLPSSSGPFNSEFQGFSIVLDGIHPYFTAVVAALLLPIILGTYLAKNRSKIPLEKKWYEPSLYKKIEFAWDSTRILARCREKYGEKPYRLVAEFGETIVLHSRYANEIRNNDGLSFTKGVAKMFHTDLYGFEPIAVVANDSNHLQDVAKNHITKYLNVVTEPLSEEVSYALGATFGDSTEWKEYPLHRTILDVVARMSSRVFLGEELCRNDEWLQVIKAHPVTNVMASQTMDLIPKPLDHILQWLLPITRQARNEVADAERIIRPIVEKRRALKREAAASGGKIPTFTDSIEWAEDASRGRSFDPGVFQLSLARVAIHTTSDLLSWTLLQLTKEPHLIDELRAEIVQVLGAQGLKKTALYNLKLVDSAFKEAQRLKPIADTTLIRLATKNLVLSDGTLIKKGQFVSVDSNCLQDSAIYEDPAKFDIHRFARMRDNPAMANKAQLVSTSEMHTGFGLGQHACPGRFFAANEVKLALCHLLLKYDWKLGPDCPSETFTFGVSRTTNPKLAIMARARKPELDLDLLEG